MCRCGLRSTSIKMNYLTTIVAQGVRKCIFYRQGRNSFKK